MVLRPTPQQRPPTLRAYALQRRRPPLRNPPSKQHASTVTRAMQQHLSPPKATTRTTTAATTVAQTNKAIEKASAIFLWMRPHIASLESQVKTMKYSEIKEDVEDLRSCCSSVEAELEEARLESQRQGPQPDAITRDWNEEQLHLNERRLQSVKTRITKLEGQLKERRALNLLQRYKAT